MAKRPSRIHLRGNRTTPIEQRRVNSALGGRTAQANGKHRRFHAAIAQELGRKGGLVQPTKAIRTGDDGEDLDPPPPALDTTVLSDDELVLARVFTQLFPTPRPRRRR